MDSLEVVAVEESQTASEEPETRRQGRLRQSFKEDRAQALHLACLTLQTNQASAQVTTQLLARAEIFRAYIEEGKTQ